jgi:hypothetical protein
MERGEEGGEEMGCGCKVRKCDGLREKVLLQLGWLALADNVGRVVDLLLDLDKERMGD